MRRPLVLRGLRAVVLTLAVTSTGLGFAPAEPAEAHTGEGVVTVEVREEVAPDAVRYVVRLTWSGDGHPATDANLVATPVSVGGTWGAPVVLTPVDADGRYEGTVVFPAPDVWYVAYTSSWPPTELYLPA